MSELQINRESLSGSAAALLRLVGDADVNHAVELAAALESLKKESPRIVVIDASGLDFISSLGIGSLLTFAHALKKNGGELRLAACKPHVEDALRRSRADQTMSIFPTLAAASA